MKSYGTLGNDINKLARDKKCDFIVVAGDVFHQSTTRPAVLHYGKKFLENLSKSMDVIVTIGQHDSDSRSLMTNPIHSVVAAIVPSRIHYVQQPQVLKFDGVSFFVHPWTDKRLDKMQFKEADIFVGHGIVKGSVDPYGYQFQSGFDASKLAEHYGLSIIGDLHEPQWIERTLVPGVPLQNNWKDSTNPGVWILDFEGGKVVDRKHVSIYDIRDNGTYHKFLTTDDEGVLAKKSTKTTHYRLAKKAPVRTKESLHELRQTTYTEITDVMLQCLQEANLGEDVKNYEERLRDIYGKVNLSSLDPINAISRSRIKYVKGTNFQSIKEFEWEFEGGDTLFIGPNGSGKSTVAELIYWTLTGRDDQGQ